MANPEISPINRRPELEYLVQREIEATPGAFAVVAIDLDDLKDINRSEGYEDGDEYIKAAREVLWACVRQPSDTDEERPVDTIIEGQAIHLAGDEYWVILRGVERQAQVDSVVERLKLTLSDYGIEASMGGRVHQPGEMIKQLLSDADDLLYDDKMRRVLEAHQLDILEEALIIEHALALRRMLGRVSLRTVEKYLHAIAWRNSDAKDGKRPSSAALAA